MSQGLELLYVPIGTKEDASQLARKLLKKKLIACANIISNMTSIYEWQGTIEEESEWVVIFKTSSDKSQECMTEIESLHPYDTPCVLKLSASDCNPAYRDWVFNQLES